jgi:hypothetical protein
MPSPAATLARLPQSDSRTTFVFQPLASLDSHKARQPAEIILDKPTLRRDGPLVFVEQFRHSYDLTPYLAIDQLALYAQKADPGKHIHRFQIIDYKDRVELHHYKKVPGGEWVVIGADVRLDPTAFPNLYHDYRGDEQYGRRQLMTKYAQQLVGGAVNVGWVNPEESLSLQGRHMLGARLDDVKPAIVACTSDSKSFSRMRALIDGNQGALKDVLVVTGGIHAIAAHNELLEHLAERPSVLDPRTQAWDLVHYGQSGEQDFSARVRVDSDEDRFNGFWQKNEAASRSNDTVQRCPSSEQFPAWWGPENPIVRRMKGAWGCQFSCSFCATSGSYARGDVQRTKEFFDSVLAECSKRSMDPSIVMVYFEDANFAGTYARQVLELAERYPFKLGLQVRFDCLRDDVIKQMQQSKVAYLFLGLESYDESLRSSVDKKNALTPQKMYDLASKLKDAGIDYIISGIVGLPSETPEAMARTILFARLLGPQVVSLELPKVYPGTALADDFYKVTGRSPGRLYSDGDELVKDPNTGSESVGSLLMPHMSESSAVAVMTEADVLMRMSLEELLERVTLHENFAPLSRCTYCTPRDDVGFYTRVPS